MIDRNSRELQHTTEEELEDAADFYDALISALKGADTLESTALIRGKESDLAAVTAQVSAVNLANDCANKVYEELTKFFAPYVGKKILKADGTFVAGIKIPDLPNTGNITVCRRVTNLSFLAWRVSYSVPNISICHEVDVCIGTHGSREFILFLDSISPPFGDGHRTNYTVAEVLEKRKRYRDAENALSKALSELRPFN